MMGHPTASGHAAWPAGSAVGGSCGCPDREPGGVPGNQRVVVRHPGSRDGSSWSRVDAKPAGSGVGASRLTVGTGNGTLRTRSGWAS